MVAIGFDAEEWELLLLSPWTVATGIVRPIRAAPADSDRGWTPNDQIRMTQATDQPSELVRSVAIELVGGPAWPATQRVIDADSQGDLRSRVLARCSAVADVLEIRASREDSQAFKAWLLALAGAVAEAAREGGVLGIAGAHVSEEERAILADTRALRCDG